MQTLQLVETNPRYELRLETMTIPIPIQNQLQGLLALVGKTEAAELIRLSDQRVVASKGAGQLQTLGQLQNRAVTTAQLAK